MKYQQIFIWDSKKKYRFLQSQHFLLIITKRSHCPKIIPCTLETPYIDWNVFSFFFIVLILKNNTTKKRFPINKLLQKLLSLISFSRVHFFCNITFRLLFHLRIHFWSYLFFFLQMKKWVSNKEIFPEMSFLLKSLSFYLSSS